MKSKILLFGSVLFFSFKLHAQQSVNTTGAHVQNSSGSVSYSIGQPFVNTTSSSGFSLAEGVQQPFEISVLGVDNFPNINLEFKVYPNPTSSKIFLNVGTYATKNLNYTVFDLSGKVIKTDKILNIETEIDLSKFPTASYVVVVSEYSNKLKTFKIIKN